MTLVRVKSYLRGTIYETRNLMIHKEHTKKHDLKQVANDFVWGDQHRCYLPQNGWVWLGGCGFDLTTLKELAPGLTVATKL